jgi:hypothetical protein
VIEPTHLGSNLIFIMIVVFMSNYFFTVRGDFSIQNTYGDLPRPRKMVYLEYKRLFSPLNICSL